MDKTPQRKNLSHVAPPWVETGSLFFITVNARARGTNTLAVKTPAQSLIKSAIQYHATLTWWLELFLVMPDHLHALLAIPPSRRLDRTLTAWKSYQTKTLGLTWPSGFFDHRLRKDESLGDKAHYIRMNPVRAGLVTTTKDWPYVWSPTDGSP